MTYTHKDFVKQLKTGYDYQLKVKEILEQNGLEVFIDDLRIRPKGGNRLDYTDKGDLFVYKDNQKISLEVKSSSRSYTSMNDYPYNDVIVDMVDNWDNKNHTSSAIINISQKTLSTFVIPVTSKEYWFKKTIKDNVKGYVKDFYFLNKKHIKTLYDLIEWIKK
jgi:hypothetical protein